MSSERKKAPSRSISSISRVGEHGAVRYHHRLECGHIEVRTRASTASEMRCVWCLKSREKEHELRALANPSKAFVDNEILMRQEAKINEVKARVAASLGVSHEQVDIVSVWNEGELQIISANVFLSSKEVRKLSGT